MKWVSEWVSKWMISPVPLQAFFDAPLTVRTWWIATLPVSSNSNHRQRDREEEKTKTIWRMMTHRMAKPNTDWCVGYNVKGSTETLVWFLWFCESNIAENCTFSPATMLQYRKCFQAREEGKFTQALSRKSRCSRIKEGLHSLRPQIFTGNDKETVLVTRSLWRYRPQDELEAAEQALTY